MSDKIKSQYKLTCSSFLAFKLCTVSPPPNTSNHIASSINCLTKGKFNAIKKKRKAKNRPNLSPTQSIVSKVNMKP